MPTSEQIKAKEAQIKAKQEKERKDIEIDNEARELRKKLQEKLSRMG